MVPFEETERLVKMDKLGPNHILSDLHIASKLVVLKEPMLNVEVAQLLPQHMAIILLPQQINLSYQRLEGVLERFHQQTQPLLNKYLC
jgi:hypothetical protein